MKLKMVWAMLAAMVALVIWSTLPPDLVTLDKSCQPASLRARVSRMIYADAFWRAQLRAVIAERDRLLVRMARPTEAETAIESRMTRLSEERGGGDKELSAEDLQRMRQQRVALMVACQMQIEERLK